MKKYQLVRIESENLYQCLKPEIITKNLNYFVENGWNIEQIVNYETDFCHVLLSKEI